MFFFLPTQLNSQMLSSLLMLRRRSTGLSGNSYLQYQRDLGLVPSFLSWIKNLYSSPVASVRTNNVTSSYFPLHRGARQGCWLSPFLFDMAIEPLAIAQRAEERIKGI